MPGEFDVYQLCPCGSGKKLKFCCHAIVTDMLKVSELQQSHQHQAALTLLETVEKKTQPRDVWSRAWVKTSKAFLLFSLGTVEEPRSLVGEVLAELPEHPLAVAVNAVLALAADGYPAAMRPIYRAFRISPADQPHLTSHLALALAQLMMSKGHFIGARQYLGLAARFDPENEDAGKMLVEFIRNARISYPVRDGYSLAPLVGNDNLKTQFDAAVTLAAQGCFSDAAKAFGGVARQEPKQPGLWWNIALCHAWAGEDPLAVEAFKAAAANEPDFESAVDCLVLARLLRAPDTSSKVPNLTIPYRLESASKLLTLLDQKPEYVRTAVPAEEDVEDDVPRPAAMYHILDRDPGLVSVENLSLENVPHILGELVIFDRQNETPARAYISACGQARFDQVTAAFTALAEDQAVADGEPEEHGFVSSENFALMQDWYVAPGTPAAKLTGFRRATAKHIVEEVWPNTVKESLGKKSPLQAAQAPELKAALAAAVVEFEIFCEKSGLTFDEGAARSRLGLPAVEPTPLGHDGAVEMASILRLRHMKLSDLSDEQMLRVADNAMRIGHAARSRAAVEELLSRPGLQDKIDVPRLCMFLSRVCTRLVDLDAALAWIVRGKQESKNRKQPLDALALWEVHELMLRSQRPDDPEIAQLANILWNYYLPKLPEIREVVSGVLNELSLPGPWNAGAVATAIEPLAGAGVGATGLWTPEAQTAGGALETLVARSIVTRPTAEFASREEVMRWAIHLAGRGVGLVEPNPPVGAVLVDDQLRLVAEGWHARFGGPHAEVEALARAGGLAHGATLFVTLEPCCHFGKTPPCVDAIVAAGVKQVVVAMQDPFPRVAGEGIARLRAAQIDVEVGMLGPEARRLTAAFCKLVETGRPYVHGKWAMTLDGRTASRTGASKWISNAASRALVHKLRGRMDAIIIGIGTAVADDPLLTARPPGPRIATRVVFDSHARLPVDSQLVRTVGEAPLMVVTSPQAPRDKVDLLRARGVEVFDGGAVPAATGDIRPDPVAVLAELGRRRMANVLVEGGSALLGAFFEGNLLDEAHVFVAPKLLGGGGKSPLAGAGRPAPPELPDLDNPEIEILDGDVYIHGPIRSKDPGRS